MDCHPVPETGLERDGVLERGSNAPASKEAPRQRQAGIGTAGQSIPSSPRELRSKQMAKLTAFFASMSEDQIGEYLYSHSVCDIANEIGVLPDDVHAWVSSYVEA